MRNYFYQSRKPTKSRSKWTTARLLNKSKPHGRRAQLVPNPHQTTNSNQCITRPPGTKALTALATFLKTHRLTISSMRTKKSKNKSIFMTSSSSTPFTPSIWDRLLKEGSSTSWGMWDWHFLPPRCLASPTPLSTFHQPLVVCLLSPSLQHVY